MELAILGLVAIVAIIAFRGAGGGVPKGGCIADTSCTSQPSPQVQMIHAQAGSTYGSTIDAPTLSKVINYHELIPGGSASRPAPGAPTYKAPPKQAASRASFSQMNRGY